MERGVLQLCLFGAVFITPPQSPGFFLLDSSTSSFLVVGVENSQWPIEVVTVFPFTHLAQGLFQSLSAL